MKNYIVTWTIDIEAETPREAALKAHEIQRDIESTAEVFDIADEHGNPIETVDLGEVEE